MDASDPIISIHALTGIRLCFGKTMQLFIVINRARLITLLDLGSTHNFVDLEAAARTGIHFCGRCDLQVVITNGDHVRSPGCCRNMPLSIANEQFIMDCYVTVLRLAPSTWFLACSGSSR
jgi:hypothetical protein